MRKLRHEEIPRKAPAASAHAARHPITVVADNIRSLHNVGSIFRTSDAAWIERLFLTGFTGTPDNHALHRTALGAQDTVPWTYTEDPLPVLQALRADGYTLATLEITDTPTHLPDLKPHHFPLCLILGNELHGVRDALINEADLALEIPQYGTKQSMNVSVAYGVAVMGLVERFRSF